MAATVRIGGRPKYRNVPTIYRGVRYPSKAEAKRAEVLDSLVLAGEVLWWVGQPKFRLGCPENVYVADFIVVTPDGTHVEDVKGVRTPKFNRDVKLWRSYGPCELHILSGRNFEIVAPIRGREGEAA